jgi:DNA polymerase-3 subunit delta'
VESFVKFGREEQKRFFKYGLHFNRGLMLHFCGLSSLNMITAEEEKVFERMIENGIIDLDKINLISDLFSETAYSIERNANPKILFLDVSITLNKILRTDRRNTA